MFFYNKRTYKSYSVLKLFNNSQYILISDVLTGLEY